MPTLSATNHLGRAIAHHTWDRDEPPALVVDPGSEISLALRDGSNGQITPGTEAASLQDLDMGQMDPLTGPIYVAGARPGDVVSVDILRITVGSRGWSAILPGLGLLSDRFPGPYVRSWDLTGGSAQIADGIQLPIRPMLGVIGVAPAAPGSFPSTVPTSAGGNMDVKYLGEGSRVLLPVFTEGALLSLGDAHALQGDGELNGTAIECEAETVIRVGLMPGGGLDAPVIETAPQVPEAPQGYRVFLGIGPDLWQAARDASLKAVDAVAAGLEIAPHEAYALLGTIAELRIHEIVDKPNWVVGCMIPRSVLP
jgi:acetamidase/formamidase